MSQNNVHNEMLQNVMKIPQKIYPKRMFITKCHKM